MRFAFATVVLSGAALFGTSGLRAQSWPQFRGPAASGVSEARKLPDTLAPDKNVIWKTTLPAGHSSPVIAGDLIFLTAYQGGTRADAKLQKIVDQGGKLLTICLDRKSGKILWQREAPRPRLEAYQPTNSPASPSPVTDGKSVFIFFGDFGLLSYGLDGNERWRLPLGPFNNVNGHGSSPILYGDLVIMLCDQDTNSYLLAVEKDTGKVRWRTERPEVTRCYTTPGILKPADGPAEIIVPGAFQLTSYAADTGKKLWWIHGLSWQPKSAPLIDGTTIYAHWWEAGGESEQAAETTSFAEMLAKFDTNKDRKLSAAELETEARLVKSMVNNDLNQDGSLDEDDWNYYAGKRASRNALLAVRHGGTGDVTESNIIWRMQKFLPNVPTPLLYQGILYLVKDGGILTAVDAASGTIYKQGRLTGALDTYYSSPVGGAGKVYLISQQGKSTVISAGKEWEILSSGDFGEEVYATPAIVGNRMYVRTKSALYCFGE